MVSLNTYNNNIEILYDIFFDLIDFIIYFIMTFKIKIEILLPYNTLLPSNTYIILQQTHRKKKKIKPLQTNHHGVHYYD